MMQRSLSLSAAKKIRLINLDLGEAVRCYEVFLPTGRDKNLINIVNEAKINPAYNTIRDSLHRSIITSLCRIWDKSRSTNNILNFLTFLRRDAKSGKNGLEVGSLLDLESRAYKVNISSEFQAIQQIRHRIIAHTADPDKPYLAMARQAVYGDERIVIEMSISIIEELNDLAGFSPQMPYSDLRKTWQEQACVFWGALARAAEPDHVTSN